MIDNVFLTPLFSSEVPGVLFTDCELPQILGLSKSWVSIVEGMHGVLTMCTVNVWVLLQKKEKYVQFYGYKDNK